MCPHSLNVLGSNIFKCMAARQNLIETLIFIMAISLVSTLDHIQWMKIHAYCSYTEMLYMFTHLISGNNVLLFMCHSKNNHKIINKWRGWGLYCTQQLLIKVVPFIVYDLRYRLYHENYS